jgi:uncharacterized protein YfaS (alpha-2-macroglobulin family)
MNEDGGLGLWAATPESSEFATVYAAHFLVDAKDRGQAIPQDVLSRMNDWLTQFAGTPASSIEAGRLRAYAVYLLVRQGIRPAAAISNVEQELTNRYPKTWQTDLAAAYLASTYRLMQKTSDAERMIRQVPWAVAKRDFAEEVYYDGTVHDAQLLYLLSRHFPAIVGTAPPPALEAMASSVSRNGASSLQAAYALIALDAFAKTASTTTTLGVSEIGKDGTARQLILPAGAIPKVTVSEAAAKVRFTRSGQSPAYFVLAESGFDRNPPTAETKQGVEISREFVDDKGNLLTRVTVGQEFFVRLRVRSINRDRQPQIAIVDVLPGGVEPVLELQPAADSSTPAGDPALQLQQSGRFGALPLGVAGKSDWMPQHLDVRDDRVILYGDAGSTAGTFVYRVRANNAGTFQVPPPFAEGMYNRTVFALGKGATLEVIQP